MLAPGDLEHGELLRFGRCSPSAAWPAGWPSLSSPASCRRLSALPQTDLHVPSLFGHEGDEAFNALRLEPAPLQRRRPARRRAPVNDAAEDVMAPPDLPEAPRPGP